MAKNVPRSKWCIVEHCKNTSISAPNKLFVTVPKLRRKAWLEAADRDPQTLSLKSTLYCCEDHFDLPNDVENWLKYTMMKCKIRFKEHVVPHIFASRPYWKRAADTTDLRVDTFKRLRTVVNTSLPVFTGHEINTSSSMNVACTVTTDQDADHTSYLSTFSAYARQTVKPLLVDKSVQVRPRYRSKYVQCQYKGIKMEEASTSHCGIEFIDVNRIDNNDKLLDTSTQTDDKSNVLFESINIKTECDPENFEDYNYTTDDCTLYNSAVQCTEECFIKTEIDIKEENLDL